MSITPDFSANVTSGSSPLEVSFTDLSTGDPVDYMLWDFGDGNTSVDQNPINTYADDGYYTVTLFVYDIDSNEYIETKTNYITVGNPIVTDFSATPLSGDSPLNVAFTDLSTNSPDTWNWDFGDGNTSVDQNPTHIYTVPGVYTVSLYSQNPYFYDDETKTNYITVTLPPLASEFSADITSGASDLTVNFTDMSIGSPDTWLWDFGDGNTSTDQNPSHIYTIAGIYTVSLTASLGASSDTETKSNYITVTMSADFSATPTSGNVPLTVNFTDMSIGSPDTWLWDFGDGNTSTSQNPTHIYDTAGTYTISLTASLGASSDTVTISNYITANLSADFSATPTSGNADLTVNFTDTTLGSPDTWLWNFGDGHTSTSQNPTHIYDTAGIYTVSLVASIGGEVSDTETKTNYLTVLLTVDFVADVTSGLAPLTVNFTDLTQG